MQIGRQFSQKPVRPIFLVDCRVLPIGFRMRDRYSFQGIELAEFLRATPAVFRSGFSVTVSNTIVRIRVTYVVDVFGGSH